MMTTSGLPTENRSASDPLLAPPDPRCRPSPDGRHRRASHLERPLAARPAVVAGLGVGAGALCRPVERRAPVIVDPDVVDLADRAWSRREGAAEDQLGH